LLAFHPFVNENQAKPGQNVEAFRNRRDNVLNVQLGFQKGEVQPNLLASGKCPEKAGRKNDLAEFGQHRF
jgi:hypothetical protein